MILETTLSAAAVARGFASYLATLIGLDPSQLRIPLGPFQLDFTAALLICLLSALLAAGTRESAVFNMSELAGGSCTHTPGASVCWLSQVVPGFPFHASG